jgi:periplasmic protein TonB
MNATLQWTYEKRDPISFVSAFFLGLLVLLLIQVSAINFSKSADVEMTAFIESPAVPEILKPLDPVKKVIEKQEIQKRPEPVMPKQVTSPFATEAPKEAKPAETPVPTEKPQVLQAPQHITPAAPVPSAQPAPAPSTASIYEAQLRAYLEKIKRYPTSREARLTRPQGAVRVWLEISRNGQVLGVGVMTSSGSNLLDGEALKTLKTGSYPAFPEDAYVGENAHKFSATLNYTLEPQ